VGSPEQQNSNMPRQHQGQQKGEEEEEEDTSAAGRIWHLARDVKEKEQPDMQPEKREVNYEVKCSKRKNKKRSGKVGMSDSNIIYSLLLCSSDFGFGFKFKKPLSATERHCPLPHCALICF
jgi:hypothetical protein